MHFVSSLRDVLWPKNKNVRNVAGVFACLCLFVCTRVNITPHFE